MRVRILTPDFDYSWGNSALDFYVDTPQAVAQAVQTSLLLWLGEWFLDITIGVPYPQGVLGKNSQATADATIQAQIVQVQGVTDIASYTSTFDGPTRQYSATATIDTIYGQTEVTLQNYLDY